MCLRNRKKGAVVLRSSLFWWFDVLKTFVICVCEEFSVKKIGIVDWVFVSHRIFIFIINWWDWIKVKVDIWEYIIVSSIVIDRSLWICDQNFCQKNWQKRKSHDNFHVQSRCFIVQQCVLYFCRFISARININFCRVRSDDRSFGTVANISISWDYISVHFVLNVIHGIFDKKMSLFNIISKCLLALRITCMRVNFVKWMKQDFIFRSRDSLCSSTLYPWKTIKLNQLNVKSPLKCLLAWQLVNDYHRFFFFRIVRMRASLYQAKIAFLHWRKHSIMQNEWSVTKGPLCIKRNPLTSWYFRWTKCIFIEIANDQSIDHFRWSVAFVLFDYAKNRHLQKSQKYCHVQGEKNIRICPSRLINANSKRKLF